MNSRRPSKLFFPSVLLLLLAAVATATLWAGPSQSDSRAPATQWQFAQMKVASDTPDNELGRQILKMGRDGWELVSVENFIKDGTTTHTAFFFKRPL